MFFNFIFDGKFWYISKHKSNKVLPLKNNVSVSLAVFFLAVVFFKNSSKRKIYITTSYKSKIMNQLYRPKPFVEYSFDFLTSFKNNERTSFYDKLTEIVF